MDPARSDQKRSEPPQAKRDLPLVFLESDPRRARVVARNLSISIAIHLVIFLTISSLPEVTRPARVPEIVADLRKAVKLVAPRLSELTQRDPNIGKPTKSVIQRARKSRQSQFVAPFTSMGLQESVLHWRTPPMTGRHSFLVCNQRAPSSESATLLALSQLFGLRQSMAPHLRSSGLSPTRQANSMSFFGSRATPSRSTAVSSRHE